MRVLVIGAGYVGRVLCQLLEGGGHRPVPVNRGGGGGARAADVTDRGSLDVLRAEVGGVDAVVHCASAGRGGDRVGRYRAVYRDGCRNLVETFAPGCLVFVSSTSVYGQTDGSVVDEGSATEPAAETGKVLLEAEALALGAGGSVARLAGIYGPGRSYLLKGYLAGEGAIDGDSADAEGRWLNQIHRDDVASALAHLLLGDVRAGIYNVVDDGDLTQRGCYRELDRRFGKGTPAVRPPDGERARGWSDKRVSNAKLRASGWSPKYPSYLDALGGDPELVPSIV